MFRTTSRLPAPVQGADDYVNSEPGGNLVFDFDPSNATIMRPEGTSKSTIGLLTAPLMMPW